MIDLSLGEFRALAAKALRGAGYPWGLADDGAYAAKRLAEFGLPAVESLRALLTAVDGTAIDDLVADPQWLPLAAPRCPICVGTAVADQGGCDQIVLPAMITPLFAAALLLTGAKSDDQAYDVSWNGGCCQVSGAGLALTGAPPDPVSQVTIRRVHDSAGLVTTHERVELSADALRELETFAHRTYAPATEASRQGAGSNSSDID